MLLGKPITPRLSPTITEATPQKGDDRCVLPPVFNLVGLPAEPLRKMQTLGVIAASSVCMQVNIQVANAAQASQNIVLLTPGWWRIKIVGSYRSSYALLTAQPGDMRILLADAVANVQIVTKFAAAAASGPQDINYEDEILLPIMTTLTTILDGNGVGQEATVSIGVFCHRLL